MELLFILPPASAAVQVLPTAPRAGWMPALGGVRLSHSPCDHFKAKFKSLWPWGFLCVKLLMGSRLSPPSQVGRSQFFVRVRLLWLQLQSWLVPEGNRPGPFNAELHCPGPGDLGRATHIHFLGPSSFSWVVSTPSGPACPSGHLPLSSLTPDPLHCTKNTLKTPPIKLAPSQANGVAWPSHGSVGRGWKEGALGFILF